MTTKTVRIIGKHVKGCFAVKNTLSGNWRSPWSSYPKGADFRDARGAARRRGSYHVWIRFVLGDMLIRAELRRLREENTKLRALLGEFLALPERYICDDGTGFVKRVRATLSAKPEPEGGNG